MEIALVMQARRVLRLVGRIMSWIGYGFLLTGALLTLLVLLSLALAPVAGLLVALLWWCSGCSAVVLGLADFVLGTALVLIPLALLALYIFRRRRR